VQTRLYLRDIARLAEVARCHHRVFGRALPANTLIAIAALVDGYEVEIEAGGSGPPGMRSRPFACRRQAVHGTNLLRSDWAGLCDWT
jgi:hypothetical protein